MNNITIIPILAILAEALIEYTKTIANMVKTGEKHTAIMQCVAIVVGILLAYEFGGSIFEYLGIAVKHYLVGIVITGILVSRGSNYISDIITKIREVTVG